MTLADRFRTVPLAALIALAASGCAPRTAGPAGPTAPGKREAARILDCRPRLFFRPEAWDGGLSIEQLRERAKSAPFAERVRLLRTTRANLALKWLMTGDETAAAEALAALKSFDPKLSTSYEGTEAIDAALAYDWLGAWPGFKAEDRAAVAERLVKLAVAMRGMLTGEGAHVFHTRMYSWAAGIGLAGLAVAGDRPEGAELFEFALGYYRERLVPARRIQGGTMHNGLSYGPNYMMFPLLQFLEAARSAAGVDLFHTPRAEDSAWLREMPAFLIDCLQPDLRHVRYADVATSDPAKHFRFMLDIFAREYRDGHAAEAGRKISERFKTSGYHAEWIYLFFAFHDPTVAPRPPAELPGFRVYSPQGVGHAFMRSGRGDGETLVHFRCGDYFENHGHFDQGGFTIFRKGPLALKGGGYWGFDTPHRHRYYKQAVSANTVIFSDPADAADEGRQRNMHYQSAGSVEEWLAHRKPGAEPRVETGEVIAVDDPAWASCSSGEFHHLAADVTAAWDGAKVRRFVRQLAWVANKHLMVVDETETARPEIRARWLLHTAVKPEPVGPDGAAGLWTVRLEESVLFVRALVPAETKATLIGGEGRDCEVNGVNYGYIETDKYRRAHKGVKDPRPDPACGLWRLELEHAKPAARRLFVTVLTADDAGAEPPAAGARFVSGALVVNVGGTEVTFKRVRE